MEKWVGWLSSHIAGVLARASIALMALLVLVEVALRTIFSRSTLLAQEYAAYLLIAFCFFSLAEVLRAGRHIRVTVLTSRLPQTVSKVLDVFNRLSTLALVLFIVFWTSKQVLYFYHHEQLADSVTQTPLFIPMLFIPIGSAFFALQLIISIVEVFKKG